MSFHQLSAKLGCLEDDGIDLPTQRLLCRTQQRGNHRPGDRVADDHDINIAFAAFPATGHGPENERQPDGIPGRRQCRAKDTRGAQRLADQAVQFFEDRTLVVDLVIRLPPFVGPDQNSSSHKSGKFPLDGARAHPKPVHDLTLIESLVGVVEEESEDRLPRQPE